MTTSAATHLARLRKELASLDDHLAGMLAKPGVDEMRMIYAVESKRNAVAKQIKRMGGK